jgi:16S rRNA (uracil1498-N3)-methyltransferase
MAVNARFFAPDARLAGDTVLLPADEALHLIRVLRLKAGDNVRVFNGRGGEFEAVVRNINGRTVAVQLEEGREAARETSVAITLAPSALKADKMDRVVRDAVMMGVTAIQPIVTTRSEVSLAALEQGRRHERWQRIAVSSAKQCGRAVVPTVHPPLGFEAFLNGGLSLPALMLVEPSLPVGSSTITEIGVHAPSSVTLIIGPEGGWGAEELTSAGRTCQFVRLGSRTLRADASPLVALTAMLTVWHDLD